MFLKTGVLIVDDQRTAQQIMEDAVMRGANRFRLVRTIANASLAELCCMCGQVGLVLMDVYTAHRENGIEAAAKIKRSYPDIRIIVCTSLPEESFLRKARAAGCESFWYKDIGDDDLLTIMDRTMAGQSVYPDHTPLLMIGDARSDAFTPKEMDVMREKVSGRTHHEIAKRLSIKRTTLEWHTNNILNKTGYGNITQLTANILEQRFIIPDF